MGRQRTKRGPERHKEKWMLRDEPNSGQTERFAQLHADVAAFIEEMHQHSVRPADPRKAWLPFGLGAGAALTFFVAAALFQPLI